MIPSILSQQLIQGVSDFLRTTFPISTPFFHGMLDRLLEEDGGIFKGQYLSIQLPFLSGKGFVGYFPEIPMRNTPYLHQERAFHSLSGLYPHSTIIATGTGSGKTEAFLYPILNYCYQHRGEPGIKAIIIYPMNALASDQAARLARLIYDNTNLRGNITAGLFVGQSELEPRMVMTRDDIITNKETQRLNPPDILLTNYKMLDYLLIRAKDYPLWKNNNSETLKYLVVDELHTFDGAQGTDLACLIRRLKARFKTPQEFLCCVGTSATLGTDEEKEGLLEYASEVFGESFSSDAVIRESRISAGAFLENSLISHVLLVPQSKLPDLLPESYNSHDEFIIAQYKLWFEEEINKADLNNNAWLYSLGERLKSHHFFQNLLKVLGGRIRSYDEIISDLEKVTPGLQKANPVYQRSLLNSLLALVSTARSKDGGPFLHVRYQMWLRELRRMVGAVSMNPILRFADDLKEEQLKRHLPIVHCRECGSMGWAGLKRQSDDSVNSDLQSFYICFFSNDPKAVFFFPEKEIPKQRLDGQLAHICALCLNLTLRENPVNCPSCSHEELIRVFVPLTRRVTSKGRQVGLHNCPYCGGVNSLTIFGSRAASLTSVMIGQLYASQFNDDKKLLTFSDSVQDAAHRAGFFAGRTYQFNLRGAIQKFVQDGGNGLALDKFSNEFIKYWSARMDESAYIATFLAPNMAWFNDYEYLKYYGHLPEGSKLPNEVNQRIDWEIYSEYGFSARIGRTLEKTSSSVAHIDTQRFKNASEQILFSLQNEIGGMRTLDLATVRKFLIGIIVHLKNLGGILHPVLEKYIERGGETYQITQKRIPWMPNFGPYTRAPSFLITGRSSRFEQLVTGPQGRGSWCESLAFKYFSHFNILIAQFTLQILEIAMKALIKEGIFEERPVRNDRVWGILPEAIKISGTVTQFRCNICHHNVSVASFEQGDWAEAHCLRTNCDGQYNKQHEAKDYYGKLYATGDIKRIFAAEHTGLLKREEREKLEEEFKREERKPWDANLLSCTPTLELGIDIGDLSSTILCSVPPTEANYLQRIGRVGRKDGNALNFTVANARPHDLYFFAEPEQMFAGRIETPGVFLKASAVLERQLTAFCFDRWVESGIGVGALPPILKYVLDILEPFNPQKFPYNFLQFIENHKSEIFDRFVKMFSGKLNDEVIAHLKIFAGGDSSMEGSLAYRIIDGLHKQHKERESLRKKVRTLTNKIRKKQGDPHDQNYEKELDELKREKSALQALVKRINDLETFNYFTNEGLIPNYAFPEAGVVLRSIIYRRKTEPREGESNYDSWTYDFERPSRSAINELAPANIFYAGGRKVEIDQVDLNVSEIEAWRFCDNCSHMVLAGREAETATCPGCGSTMWSDSGQKRQMLRMRQVFATNSDRDSRIGDESDDREPKFYNTQMMVGADERHITSAYKINSDEMPFGFEFVSKVTFREINFGEKGEIGENVTIAGTALNRKGFVFCKNCGKIQEVSGKNKGKIIHALTCTARDQDSDKNLTECVYLYREFSSEAIRILLPVTTFSGSDKKLHSFVATLQLGLKLKFKGNIAHLQTTVYEEPVSESVYRKKYLVLYDTVPGGTGYLKELMRPQEPLMEVFEMVLERLKICPCNQETGKDGCYRCLYAYRSSYNMSETSRNTAIELLSDILKYRNKLIKTKNLKNIQINSLFDSELEARFIEALRQIQSNEIPVTLRKELVNGKPGYFFKIGECVYYIELQVNLGKNDGVSVPSKADFIFRPARVQKNVKPIAVFTDGFFYHRDRIGQDVSQRNAITRSGKYYVWSLSWKDIENRYIPQGEYYRNYINVNEMPNKNNFSKLLESYTLESFRDNHKKNSFELFIAYLKNPEEETWQKYAFVHGLMHLDFQRFAKEASGDMWVTQLLDIFPHEIANILQKTNKPRHYGIFEPQEEGTNQSLRLFTIAEEQTVRQSDPVGLRIACILFNKKDLIEKKEFESIWNGYLRLHNLYQFLPYGLFATKEGMIGSVYEEPGVGKEPTSAFNKEGAWAEVMQLIDPAFHIVIDKIVENEWPLPEVGFELANSKGEVIAEAELAWPDLKIAFLLPENRAYIHMFEQEGWRAVSLQEVISNPDHHLNLHKT